MREKLAFFLSWQVLLIALGIYAFWRLLVYPLIRAKRDLEQARREVGKPKPPTVEGMMRLEDMVLRGRPVETAVPWFFGDALRAQHEADMAYEVACPCGYHRPELSECDLCSGTGRVTLGQIVAADRARKR